MPKITFISTVHSEFGRCNANELHTIIETIRPEIIFLEALEDTYSDYQKVLFSSFDVLHEKLEIKALQKYGLNANFEYIPVLDNELSGSFDKKYNVVCENIEFKDLLDNFNLLASEHGFQFLNSDKSIRLQEKMRVFENHLLIDNTINTIALSDIDAYEDSMLRNIYKHCEGSHFSSAIFMCGVAHRKSIIEKIEKFKTQEEKIILDWSIYGT